MSLYSFCLPLETAYTAVVAVADGLLLYTPLSCFRYKRDAGFESAMERKYHNFFAWSQISSIHLEGTSHYIGMQQEQNQSSTTAIEVAFEVSRLCALTS